MDDFKVTILGSGSAVPTSWHNPSSQVLSFRGQQFMFDCGEGSQMQMIRYNVKPGNLNHIFISHLHGDHYYGLIGLINSFHLMRREQTLYVYGPAELKNVIETQLQVSNTKLYYPTEFHSLRKGRSELVKEENYTISAFPLKHSIPVWGFIFEEKESGLRLSKDFVDKYKPSVAAIKHILVGKDYQTENGETLLNREITLPPKPARSYAYCSDTAYQESTSEYVKNVNLLYHESTFNNSQKELAKKTLHSTAVDAAEVAKKARAKKLLLGHYSARFRDLESLLGEAKSVFPESYLSKEGEVYIID